MTSPPTCKTLDAFGPFPYRVVWRRETRINADGTKYETKITYDPRSGKLAAVDNPQTWQLATRRGFFQLLINTTASGWSSANMTRFVLAA